MKRYTLRVVEPDKTRPSGLPETIEVASYSPQFILVRFPRDWTTEECEELVETTQQATDLAVIGFTKTSFEGGASLEVVDVVESETSWDRISKDEDDVDGDLGRMPREELVAEIKKLRAGIRAHRDRSGHDLCWHVPELWGLLPENHIVEPVVPPKEEFHLHCLNYRASLDGVPEPELAEEDLLVRTITHPAGYIATLFAFLWVRGNEDPDIWSVEWDEELPKPHHPAAVGELLDRTPPNDRTRRDRTFPTAREAVRFFLELRNCMELGIDHEIRLSKLGNQ